MGRRILFYMLTNLLVVLTISVLMSVLGIGGYTDGRGGLDIAGLAIFCLVWGMAGSFISLQLSRWMAKRAMDVRLIDGRTGHGELDRLYQTVEHLVRKAGLPMPEVGVYPSDELNAFATGPSKRRSLVAVSTGLLSNMDEREMRAVLAHEVSHIGNGDMVTMALMQGVVNAFAMFFARLAAFAVRQALDSRIAGLVAFLVRIALEIALTILGSLAVAWFSRQREFRADAGAARLVDRESMIAALRRLATASDRIDTSNEALASFKIAGGKSAMSLFASHPPIEDRIAALQRGV